MDPQISSRPPAVGVGFRLEAWEKTIGHLENFETVEITVDHYLAGGEQMRERMRGLRRQIRVVGHGVGLSLGTAAAPDPFYLDQVAGALEDIGAEWYSEHLAFTKIPGRDLAQLMPLPRTEQTAGCVINNLEKVRRHIHLPFALENITYYFDYKCSVLSELEFINLICRGSGTTLLLDLENLYLNSLNHKYDPVAFIDNLPANVVKGVHVAGGTKLGDLMIDSHDTPVPDAVLRLLKKLLRRQAPDIITLERDDRLEFFDEVLEDVRRLKETVHSASGG